MSTEIFPANSKFQMSTNDRDKKAELFFLVVDIILIRKKSQWNICRHFEYWTPTVTLIVSLHPASKLLFRSISIHLVETMKKYESIVQDRNN